MSYKVLITTSGVGSRLGDFTKYTNKSLLRIGNKPPISYIVESYPIETKYVITLGYYGNQVKDFLEIAYPERTFEFVWVTKYEGEGSSLLFSISQAKNLLQEPFIFHASDTIVTEGIPEPTHNWNAGFKGLGSSSYASFDVLGDSISIVYEKGNLNPDFLHIGLVGIYDFKLFWEIVQSTLEEEKFAFHLGDVDVLKKMTSKVEFKAHDTKKWYDIGNVDKMSEAKAALDIGDLHVLDKLGESIFKVNNHVVKFFFDEVVCQNRVKRNEYLGNIVPKINLSTKNFYKYPFVKGDLFANVANKSNFVELLDWANQNLWVSQESIPGEKIRELCLDFYFTKTEKRLEQLFSSRGVEDKEEIINGELVPSISSMLRNIDKETLCNTSPTMFHGDFILDNILKTGSKEFVLIDWRQDFAGELTFGDKYYDLGKLAHNLVVNHELIDKNHFTVKKEPNGNINLNIHRLQTLVECESLLFDWVKENKLDVNKIKILRSIIWLNMAPLHHHPFDLFLYYFGKYNLYQSLKNAK